MDRQAFDELPGPVPMEEDASALSLRPGWSESGTPTDAVGTIL